MKLNTLTKGGRALGKGSVESRVQTVRDVTAVKDFQLDIEDQEFLVLVGPSGCGKSTTLRMIAGLEEISEGEIYIGDRVVNDVPPKDRDIAMVFQSYALYPHMNVYDNMAFGLKLRKISKARDRATRRRKRRAILGIEHLLDRKPKAALRRPAAARRPGPRHRPRAAGLPDGRAAVQPGCQAARPDARGDQQAAPAAARPP